MTTPENAEPRVYLDRERIAARVAELGRQISEDYTGEPVVLLGVLKGSFVFLADLARAIEQPVGIEFLGVRSYGDDTESSGAVQITQDLTRPVEGRHVIIVEDIVDTGLTAHYLIDQLSSRKPLSVRLCSLLHKPARCQQEVTIDYLGFTIEDVFVVGYGLDWAQRFRNLADICIVDM